MTAEPTDLDAAGLEDDDTPTTCPTCDGDGWVTAIDCRCSGPWQEGCGGCYERRVRCDDCGGGR